MLPLWNNSFALAFYLVTGVLAVACLAVSFMRRSAALKNSILLPTLIITLAIPPALMAARESGWSIAIPLLETDPVAGLPEANRGAGEATPPVSSSPGTAGLRRIEASSGATPDTAGASGVGTPVARTTDPSPDAAAPTGTDRAAPWSALPLTGWLMAIWLLGSVFCVLRLWRSYRSLKRLLADARPSEHAGVAAAAAQAWSTLGLATFPRLVVTDRVSSPMAFGSPRRGWVIFPPDSLERMPHDRVVHVLTHEGAHIAHRDSSLRLMQGVVGAIWWWHPLVHVLNRLLSRTREELCDNAVLTGADPVAYGQTLLDIGRPPASLRRPVLAPGLFPEHERLEHRIRSLLNPRRSTVDRSKPTAILTVCLAGVAASAIAGTTRMTTAESEAIAPLPAPVVLSSLWSDQDGRTLEREFALSIPDARRPAHLDIDIKRGDILVTAYEGSQVLVRLSVPSHQAHTRTVDADGFQTITGRPLDFEVRQSENFIELDANDYHQVTHVEVLVPRHINLTLDSYRTGIIRVTGVEGHVNARSQNNDIVLTDISGSADVYGYNGSFTASFREVTGELAFETYNGNVDLTLPADTRSTTLIRSERYDVRSQFAIAERPAALEVTELSNGGRSVDFGEYAVGDINGGGDTTLIETTNGTVLLRKGTPLPVIHR